jgi:hypothetical protein
MDSVQDMIIQKNLHSLILWQWTWSL